MAYCCGRSKTFVFQLKNIECNLRQILRAVNDLTNEWSFKVQKDVGVSEKDFFQEKVDIWKGKPSIIAGGSLWGLVLRKRRKKD